MTTLPDLEEPFHETGYQRWRRQFPWLHVLRVPGIAAGPRLLLAGFLVSYVLMILDVLLLGLTVRDQIPTFARVAGDPWNTVTAVLAPNTAMYLLAGVYMGRDATLFPGVLLAYFVVYLVGGLLLSRLAARVVTTGVSFSLTDSLRFTGRKLPDLLLALLFPCLGVLLLSGCAGGLLLLEKIPGIGPWLAGFVYGGTLLLLFFTVLLVGGLVLGWPLLVTTLAVENSNGFDAWSRGFDYLRARVVSYVLIVLLTLLGGMLALMIASELVEWTLAWTDSLQSWLLGLHAEEIQARSRATFDDGPGGFQNLWRLLWLCLLNGYLLSLYWTTLTMAYVLLRLSVDRIPLEEPARD